VFLAERYCLGLFHRFPQMAYHLPQDVNHNSPQIKLMLDWMEGWKEKNVESIGKCLHKDFKLDVYPRRLGEQTQHKEEFLKQCKELYVRAQYQVGSTPCYSSSLPTESPL
jgi:hypothetical protein